MSKPRGLFEDFQYDSRIAQIYGRSRLRHNSPEISCRHHADNVATQKPLAFHARQRAEHIIAEGVSRWLSRPVPSLDLPVSNRPMSRGTGVSVSKLRGCDLLKLRIGSLIAGQGVRTRAMVIQQKTGRPVQFEIMADTRGSLVAWLQRRGGTPMTTCSPVGGIAAARRARSNMPGSWTNGYSHRTQSVPKPDHRCGCRALPDGR